MTWPSRRSSIAKWPARRPVRIRSAVCPHVKEIGICSQCRWPGGYDGAAIMPLSAVSVPVISALICPCQSAQDFCHTSWRRRSGFGSGRRLRQAGGVSADFLSRQASGWDVCIRIRPSQIHRLYRAILRQLRRHPQGLCLHANGGQRRSAACQ
jgi:hypothetical protein